jgi:ribosome-associated translation inhibitor RaiA
MLAQIQFIKMSRSEGVETYLTNQLEDLQELIPSNKAHFRVWVECLNSQIQPGKDMFRCAIKVEGLKGKHIFVEKRNENFYLAANDCVEAIRKMFRREKKMLRNYKKRATLRNFGMAAS